jgi:hypothetical protein
MGLLGRGSGDSAEAKGAPPPAMRPATQVQVQLGEHEAEGIYSNLVLISHSASEFILDFARMLPGIPKAKVYSRIIMTPQNAMSLREVLQRNLQAYEEKHGKIPVSGPTEPSREIGFK